MQISSSSLARALALCTACAFHQGCLGQTRPSGVLAERPPQKAARGKLIQEFTRFQPEVLYSLAEEEEEEDFSETANTVFGLLPSNPLQRRPLWLGAGCCCRRLVRGQPGDRIKGERSTPLHGRSWSATLALLQITQAPTAPAGGIRIPSQAKGEGSACVIDP